MKLIDKEKLLNRLNNPQGKPLYWDKKTKSANVLDWYDAVGMVEEAPVVDERKKGKWVRRDIKGIPYCCSVCSGRFDYEWKYCPNCGADMRGEQDAETN